MKEDTIKKQINEFNKQTDTLKNKSVKIKTLKAEIELERLTNQKFYNPYDVLQLQATASDDDINKQYRAYAIILHPDRCKDPRAQTAFDAVKKAHQTLGEPEKRKVYLRIMRQAREKTQFQRQKENKARTKKGQLPLPDSTFHQQYYENCQVLFREIESKKEHITKMQQSNHRRRMDEIETKKVIEQFKVLTEEEWERSREKRVANWRDFSANKNIVGSRRSNGSIRPPPTKAENRPHYSKIDDRNKNL